MPIFQRFSVFSKKRVVDSHGFTLVELVVVMALVGIMMFVAVPSFQHILTDDTRKASQWILVEVPRLKARAASEMKTYALHVDLDNSLLWISNDSMPDEELDKARNEGRPLSNGAFFHDVVFSDSESVDSGEAEIYFYPKGYSDKAIIHMEDGDGNRRSFIIEPFLSQVDMREGYVNFEK